jgi:signal transduction histidine kinase
MCQARFGKRLAECVRLLNACVLDELSRSAKQMKRIENRSAIDMESAEAHGGNRIEWLLNHLLLLAFLSLAFGTMGSGGVVEPLMLPLTMVIAVWAGLRLRLRGALGVLVILSLFLTYAWGSRIGVFSSGTGAAHLFFAVGLLAIFATVAFLSAIVAGYHLRSAQMTAGREHMLHTVLDSLPIGVWVRSPGGETVFVNERWASFSLMSVREIMNSASTQAPVDLGAQWESERQALLSGDAGGVRCQRVDLIDHTGTHCCMTLLTLRMYIDDVCGVGTLSLLVDETALRLYEQRVQTSEHRLRMALDNLEMAFWEQDFDEREIYRDANWYRILDIAEDKVDDERQEWQGRIHPDDHPRVLGAYRAFLANASEPLEMDYRIRKGEREYIWVQERVVALERNAAGRLKRIVGTMLDISARKRVEIDLQHAKDRAEAGNRAKGQFLATVSHEIRTPLNAIIGLSSLLSEGDLNEEQLDLSKTIYTSGKSLLRLVNDILDFSKIDAGRLDLEVQEFPLLDCFEECIKLFKPRAVERGVSLELILDPGLTEFAMGDMQRLRQIVQNLLSNAVKFTEQGEVQVAVRPVSLAQLPVERQPDSLQPIGYLDRLDHDYLEVLVRDTGIGVPDSRQQELFEAFTQVDASTTRKYGGTGLGLAICQRLVRAMGGKIWVESDAGKGAVFGFIVRTQFISEAAPISGPSIDRVERIAKQHPCDMLIVGNRLGVEPLLSACRNLGYTPHHAPNYDLSADWFQRRRYGLVFILMDDEAQALELSRKLSGSTRVKRPPVVLGVVPKGRVVSNKRCKLAGMQHLIEETLDARIIRDVLLDVLCVHD